MLNAYCTFRIFPKSISASGRLYYNAIKLVIYIAVWLAVSFVNDAIELAADELDLVVGHQLIKLLLSNFLISSNGFFVLVRSFLL